MSKPSAGVFDCSSKAATDHELLASAVAGNDQALGALVSRHRDRALKLAYWMVQGDGEDAVQEADLAVIRSIHRVRESFGPWYLGIVRNKCLKIVRGRRPTVALHDAEGAALDLPVDDTSFWVREKLSSVVAATRALSVLELNALVMHEVSDHSFRDIAQVLGCASESSAKDAACRARRKIAERMTEQGW